MESPTQLRSRRWKGRLIRIGLVGLAVALVASWIHGRVGDDSDVTIRRGRSNVGGVSGVQRSVEDATLGPGDLRIYNRDRTVDLVLQGDKILAGLSPEMVAKIRADMAKSSDKDTSGIGGLIASTVKQTVANTIGTHVSYPLSDIRDIRFEDGQLVAERMNGKETRLFGNTKVNGTEQAKTFDEAEAERFIQAVRARKRELGQ